MKHNKKATPKSNAPLGDVDDLDCIDCEAEFQDDASSRCVYSMRSCGHHCNHMLTHDTCCWCGEKVEV